MKIAIPHTFSYQFWFVMCILATYFDNYELTFGVWALAFLYTLRLRFSTDILRLLVPYLLIILIAFFSCLGRDFKLYFAVRDITYLIKPVLGFMIGYQILYTGIKKPFDLIATTGVIVASYHLVLIAYAIVFERVFSIHDLRYNAGYFSDFEVYALLVLLFHKPFGLTFSPQKIKWFTFIVALSTVLYLARTNFIQFIVLYLALKGYFALTKRSITIFTTVVVLAVAGYSAIVYMNPRREAKGIEGLLYKIKVAPLEPFKTKIDVTDYKDFNDNYRSYENIRTVRQVVNDGTSTLLWGKGLGSTVDLKQEVNLGGTDLRYISILHNGFMIVLLKAGLVGIVIYLFTIIFFFRNKKSDIEEIQYINLLFLGTGIFLFISNWVFLGFYNLTESKSILIGFLIAYRNIYRT